MRTSRQVEIANVTRGTVLGSEIRVANTALSRLVGLLADSGLRRGCGLLIQPSSGVHTFGMRFPIDVVALDRNYKVRGLWEGLGPWRIAALGVKTQQVLELPVGAIHDSGTQLNDQLLLQDPTTLDQLLHPVGSASADCVRNAANFINQSAKSTKGEHS